MRIVFVRQERYSAGLPGSYKAWLSTSTVDARDRIPNTAYFRIDGTNIAYNLFDLTDGSLNAALNITELNQQVSGNVSTGTSADGTASGSTCNNWNSSSSGVSGRWGESNVAKGSWTASGVSSCNLPRRVYCFQVDTPGDVVLESTSSIVK